VHDRGALAEGRASNGYPEKRRLSENHSYFQPKRSLERSTENSGHPLTKMKLE
jgi:hypothetical protein